MSRVRLIISAIAALALNTVNVSANCVTDMDTGSVITLSIPENYYIETLLKKSIGFATSEEVPGGPAGFKVVGIHQGRYLKTKDILESDLPYSNAIRPIDRVGLADPEIPRLDGRVRAFDVFLVSEVSSGVSGVVRLGLLDGRRPVAIKYYAYEEGIALSNVSILREAGEAKTLSGLGVLSQFHGIYLDEEGRYELVTDIVDGDFSGTPVTEQTFADLREMEDRMINAKQVPDDLQVYRTGRARLQMIDASAAKDSGQGGTKRAQEFDFAYARTLFDANAAVGQLQLQGLKMDPRRYRAVIQKAREMLDNGWSMPEYLVPVVKPR